MPPFLTWNPSLAIKNELKKYGTLLKSYTVADAWQDTMQDLNTIDDFDKDDIFDFWCSHHTELIERIKQADICVFNGEGTLWGWNCRIATKNLLYLIYILKTRYQKTVYVINHSCFPIWSPYDVLTPVCDIYRKVYSIVDFCAVRDVYSLAILNKIGVSATLSFDCLPLYVQNLFMEKKIKLPKNYICINGGATFYQKFEKFIKHDLRRYKKISRHFIFLISDTNIPAEDDLECIKKIKKTWLRQKLQNIIIDVYWANDVDEWLTCIKNAKLLISGRFHHSIAAHTFNVPCICFDSNTPKTTVIRDILNHTDIISLSQRNFLPFMIK